MGREPASVRGALPVGRRTGHGRQMLGVMSQESDGGCKSTREERALRRGLRGR